jgi:DNA-directed RNA polymerase sigma subunit (sigma70/sigma32)
LAGLTAREAKALRKLRHPTRSDYLRSFLDE